MNVAHSSTEAASESHPDACFETEDEPSGFHYSTQGGHVEGSGEEEVRHTAREGDMTGFEHTD